VAIKILATDRQLQVIGDPITGWTRLEVALRYNEPSAASISLPLSAVSAGQIEPGCRLVVIRDGRVLISGPIERGGPSDGQRPGRMPAPARSTSRSPMTWRASWRSGCTRTRRSR